MGERSKFSGMALAGPEGVTHEYYRESGRAGVDRADRVVVLGGEGLTAPQKASGRHFCRPLSGASLQDR